MNITQAILFIYPYLEFGKDFEVYLNNYPSIKWYNKKILQPTDQELQDAWIQLCKENCKNDDLQDFSTLEWNILKINESLKTCTAYKDAWNCPQPRMDRILLQEADLLKRKSDAETLRNNKLDYLIETYSDWTTEWDMLIIEEVNNILLWNI